MVTARSQPASDGAQLVSGDGLLDRETILANAKLDAALGRHAGVALDHRVLNLEGAAHGVDDGTELDQRAVAGPLDHAPVMYGDSWIDEIAAQSAQSRQSTILVHASQTAESDYVGG